MLKYGLHSRIRAPASVSQKNHCNSSICTPDAVSISSRHRRISDIKSPDSLVLEIPPLSPSEIFPNSSVLSSPSTIIHHNNSYTNIPAIPKFDDNLCWYRLNWPSKFLSINNYFITIGDRTHIVTDVVVFQPSAQPSVSHNLSIVWHITFAFVIRSLLLHNTIFNG